MLRPFTLHRPSGAEEACDLLSRLGEDAVPYAGGTELLLLMKEGLLRPRHLVDVKRIPGLDAIVDVGADVTIGAAVTHRTVERSAAVRARCPVLASVARHVANVRVRNVGTVGGNLAFADPHSDLATLFLALDARVQLVSPRGRRELSLDDFVRGPWETARAADELLTAVTLTPWAARTAAAYVKFGVHERPTLGVAVALRLEPAANRNASVADARLAIGCVDPRPARVPGAEARLRACPVADLEDVVAEVGARAAASVDPADDLYGSADYKREMVAVFTRRALRAAAARARGVEPAAHYQYAVVA
ncbi:MAG TPA: xanthine dehydrogenase family protein subunit M [Patescibacteria group bacterium]|nr:xanthine dehydrogenase family protein subunit M [Patescibacteria group bacterium]